MTSVLSVIAPVVGILLLSKVVASTRILSDEGWLGLETIAYFVLFPALIVSKIAVADFSGLDWRMPVALIGAQLVMAGVSIALGKLLKQPRNRLGVLVQSGVRWNAFIALAIAQDLIGPAGLALMAAAAAAMIPSANMLSIIALTHYSNGAMGAGMLLKRIALNPLIIAFAIGLTINQLGIGLAPSVATFLDLLAQAAIAMGLLASGPHIKLKGGDVPPLAVFGWSIVRLLGLPLAAGAIAIALAIPPDIFLVVLIATAVPTASNGAILARQLGGDATLGANLIAVQTVSALISFAAILWAAEALRLT